MLSHIAAPVIPRAAAALGLSRTLGPAEAGVAITFDDGPHPQGTPQVLQILGEHGAVATFFVVGEQVQRRPDLVRRILAEGHAVALHGHRHRLQLRLPARVVREDLARGLAAIGEATGQAPTHHRPPYGIYSPAGLDAVRERGLEPLLWSAWGKDWRKLTTPARIARRATRAVGPGSVILLHDADFYSAAGSHERTALALPLILSQLKAQEIGTVLTI
jgi:peptidoglycan/xylan/chitin deacetylase (PgdA/CDA1 family)